MKNYADTNKKPLSDALRYAALTGALNESLERRQIEERAERVAQKPLAPHLAAMFR